MRQARRIPTGTSRQQCLFQSQKRQAICVQRDSYDNALAETVNGLYKTEIIYSKRVWPSATAVEIDIQGR
jgi:transposase InsO family protein